MLLITFVLALWLSPTPADAGPVIVPFLIAAGATALGTVTAAGVATLTVLGTIVSFGISLAISVGLSLLANALFAPKAPRPSDVAGMVRQNLPARMRHYGTRRVGGSLLAIETENGRLHMVAAHGEGEWNAFLQWIVDDRDVTLDEDGWAISAPYQGSNYDGVVKIESRLGTADQTAYASLIERIPALWTTDHRARGVVTSYLYARQVGQGSFSKLFPNRIPAWNVIAETAKVFDPRDEGQIGADRSTHEFSRNLSLQFADYLAHQEGMQIPQAYINLERLSAAADVCDEAVTVAAGGTIPRYAGGLSYSFDSEPSEVVGRFLKAMDGRLTLQPDGTIGIDAGAWVEPTVIIGDAHILAYELRDGAGPQREANEIIVNYTLAGSRYVEGQAEPWRDEDAISESGERRTMTIDAFEVEHHNHARRLAKLAGYRSAPTFRGQIITDLCGLNAWGERWVRFQVSLLGIDHAFEIESMAIDVDAGRVSFQVLAFDGAAAYAFDAASEEGNAPVDPEIPPEDEMEVPEGLVATTGERVSAGTTIVYMALSWSPPERSDLTAEAQIAPSGSDGWLGMTVSDDGLRAEYAGVDETLEYDVRVRFKGPGGAVGDWASLEDVSADPDASAPAPPTDLSVSLHLWHGGAVDGRYLPRVNYRTSISPNFSHIRIYRSTTSDFVDAVILTTRYGPPDNSSQWNDMSVSPGTFYYWVDAVNLSGVASSEEYAGSRTAT